MGELSEDSDSSARGTAGGGGDGGSDQPGRPKLVALPVPAVDPAPADKAEPASTGAAEAEPASTDAAAAEPTSPAAVAAAAVARADADRLALERSLSGPPLPASPIAGAASLLPSPLPATAAAGYASSALSATAAAGYASSPLPATAASPSFYTSGTPQPHGLADAIALTATPELVQALRAELAMRARAEAGLRVRAIDAETRLATRVLLSQRTAEVLRLTRAELTQLGRLLTDERARRQAAEQRVAELEQQLATDRGRSDDAAAEIATWRGSLEQLRTPVEAQATSVPGGESLSEVRADRLNDALTRLRAGTEPIDPLPAPATPATPATPAPVSAAGSPLRQATFAAPFRTLCRRDPALAGQLALSLLPLQSIAYPQPVSYDIVLGPGHGCVQVTSGDGGTEVARLATARPLEQVDFQLVGGPEQFAKLLAAGRIRRRFGFWVLSRVRGNREGLEALDALLALPLELPALVETELSTDPLVLAQLHAWINRA